MLNSFFFHPTCATREAVFRPPNNGGSSRGGGFLFSCVFACFRAFVFFCVLFSLVLFSKQYFLGKYGSVGGRNLSIWGSNGQGFTIGISKEGL